MVMENKFKKRGQKPGKGRSSKLKHNKKGKNEDKLALKKMQLERKEINELMEQYSQVSICRHVTVSSPIRSF